MIRLWAQVAVAVAVAGTGAGCIGQPGQPGQPSVAIAAGSSAAVRSTPTPPHATAAPIPSSSITLETASWQSASDQDAVRGVQFWDVAWTGERFVSTGVVPEAGGIFLDSLDGRNWHAQSGLPPSDRPVHLAAGPTGVVAIGTIDDAAASWFSPDGLTWTRRAGGFPIDPRGSDVVEVTDVVATEGGWLAVGREDPFCQTNCGLDPVRALAWRSTDGLHWRAIASAPSLARAAMTAVTRHGTGYVAVGLTDSGAAAWSSADGTTWTRAADDPVFDRLPSPDPSEWTTMSAVASGHDAVVAVGSEGPGGAHGPAARAWWSADGRIWATAGGEAFGAHGEISVMLADVATTPDGFVAVGNSNGACRGGIWESADGRAWQCAGDPALAQLVPSAVAASDAVTVVVGLTNLADPPLDGFPGAAWWRTLP